MIRRFLGMTLGILALGVPALWSGVARAHPHVFVDAKAEIVYDAAGKVVAVKHDWTFDDMYSAFAVEGAKKDAQGGYSREALEPLAKVNVESLHEFDFFTIARFDGKKLEFAQPVDYWLSYADNRLTLHFSLPLKVPAAAKTAIFEIYDPTYYVDFALMKQAPVALANAPSGCALNVKAAQSLATAGSQGLSESFFSSLNAKSDFGAGFANRIMVVCP